MKHSIVWLEKGNGYLTEKIGSYRGVKVEKTSHFYYFGWSEHVDWAAPHSRLSLNYRSAIGIKRAIDAMLDREAKDLTVIVRRFDKGEQEKLWSMRGYDSPIGAANRKEA